MGWFRTASERATAESQHEPKRSARALLKLLCRATRFTTSLSFRTRRRRIAITGLAGTGKTVFLTTLINHLKHHDPDEFHLFKPAPPGRFVRSLFRRKENNAEVREFEEMRVPDGLTTFNHEAYARAMQSGYWPRKTVDVSAYACRFNTSHGSRFLVEFLDWPGERVADVIMCGRDYAEWSNRLLRHWEDDDPSYERHVAPYLAALRRTPLSESSILAEYRLALSRLVLNYSPLISPSCFLVGRDGNRLSVSTAEQLAERGVSGSSAEAQFAPLSPEARQRDPELADAFARRYSEYRAQVVDPLFDALRDCTRLIVLVDIPSILASGHNRLNDNYQIIDEMLSALVAGTGRPKNLAKGIYNAVPRLN